MYSMLSVTFRHAFLKKNLNKGLGTNPKNTDLVIDPVNKFEITPWSSYENTSGMSMPFVVSKSIKVAALMNLLAGTSPCHPSIPNGC